MKTLQPILAAPAHRWAQTSTLTLAVLTLFHLAMMPAGGQVTVLSETFEGAFPGGWSVGDGNTTGTPAYWDDVYTSFGGEGAHGGTWKGYCAGTGYGGTSTSPRYRDYMNAYMSKTLNLSGYSSATLSFWYKIPSTESGYDKLRVYINNNLIWERSTAQASWTYVSLSLNSYLANITLKFTFESDWLWTYEGAYLDDILVTAISCVDSFEPDNSAGTARPISDGQTQARGICVGDEDWATFTLSDPASVLLRTGARGGHPGGDTELWLYGPNNPNTLIAYSDDFSGLWSQISTNCLSAGTYYVRVREYANNDAILGYTLYLDVSPPTCACNYGLSLRTWTASARGGSLLVNVTTTPECTWTVQNPCSAWLTMSRLSGVGSRALTMTAAPNTGAPRSCWLQIANHMFSAHQSGFGRVKGTYAGLFYPPAGVTHANSGFFNLTVGPYGGFSGMLRGGSVSNSIAGQFDSNGRAATLLRPGGNPILLTLQLDVIGGSDQVTGSVSNALWQSQLVGYRAVFHPVTNLAPWRGSYTLSIAGAADPNLAPAGYACSRVTVGPGGYIQFLGTLADGSAVSQTVPVSRNGDWPLYVSLYGGRGSLMGWLRFDFTAPSDVSGELNWIRPQMPLARYYPSGFSIRETAAGFRYQAPLPYHRVLDQTNFSVRLAGGNLSSELRSDAVLTPTNRFWFLAGNPYGMAVQVTRTNGVFSGSFIHPATGQPVAVRGTVYQELKSGAGYFLGPNQSGRIFLLPAP